jgi:hypothetical protein
MTYMPNMTEQIRIFRYIPRRLVDAAMSVGWLPTAGLDGTHHGAHACLMEFVCSCGREPAPIGAGLENDPTSPYYDFRSTDETGERTAMYPQKIGHMTRIGDYEPALYAAPDCELRCLVFSVTQRLDGVDEWPLDLLLQCLTDKGLEDLIEKLNDHCGHRALVDECDGA